MRGIIVPLALIGLVIALLARNNRKARMTALLSVLGIVVGVPVCLVVAFKDFGVAEERVTLHSQSPDASHRVVLRELPVFLDRNFSLVLEDARTGHTNEIFRSPDEGPPGSERIVWSEDSNRFLLLGTNFCTRSQASLPSGEQLYLVYDTVSGRLRCNASQQDKYEPFTTNDITATKWVGFRP